jgi:predicted nucleic acid-binding protein
METKLNYLLDTCILIDYLRGEPSVYDILVKDNYVNLSMSTITMMELLIGALNKREVHYIQAAFKKIGIIHINETISRTAQELITKYTKSHNLQIDDALIGATAITMNMQIITYNVSDFRYLPNISLYQFSTQ